MRDTINNLKEMFANLTVVNKDMILPTTDDKTGCAIFWTSSNEDIISSAGQYFRPYKATTVTLTANISNLGSSSPVSFNVLAEGYKDLSKTIASSYIYREFDQVGDLFFDTLDIINCAFSVALEDGTLSGLTFYDHIKKYIIPRAHEKGCWVILTIAPGSKWSSFAGDANKIAVFTNEIVAAINEYGFDGVDLDWEHPKAGEETWFTTLAKAVNQKVKANNPNHLVTAAITGGKWQITYYDICNSGLYLDYINLMTYGLSASGGLYQSALYANPTPKDERNKVGFTNETCSVDESVKLLKRDYNIPYSKIIVGAAFYGLKQMKEATETGFKWRSAGSVFYTILKNEYFNNDDYVCIYDDIAQVPYVIDKEGTIFISYEDPQAISEKCNYVVTEKLAGLMYWENGCDLTGELLGAVKRGLKK